jgi:siroheme synthase (precorrin-2 oxidase/ferrochelatase)
MATNSNETASAPQKAADAVFVPTQEHGFNNKVQGNNQEDFLICYTIETPVSCHITFYHNILP